MKLVANCQHVLIMGSSVLTNMLRCLRFVHEALDGDTETATRTFYTDFAEDFDEVPHRVFLKTLARVLEVYLKDR